MIDLTSLRCDNPRVTAMLAAAALSAKHEALAIAIFDELAPGAPALLPDVLRDLMGVAERLGNRTPSVARKAARDAYGVPSPTLDDVAGLREATISEARGLCRAALHNPYRVSSA